MNHVNFSNKSVIKLILQFLLENGLLESYFTLSNESGVSLNWVESLNKIETIVSKGLWDELIEILKYIQIPAKLQAILFEHIALELLELKEPFVAQYLIENNKSLFLYDNQFNEKYNKLLEIIKKSKDIISSTENTSVESNYSSIFTFIKNNYIERGSKEKSRERLSKLILENLVEVKKSVLLEVIGNSLRYKNTLKLNSEEICESFGSEFNENSFICDQRQLQLNGSKELKFFMKSPIIIDSEKFGYICCINFSPSGEQIFATSKGYIFIGNTNFCNGTDQNVELKRIYSHCEEEVKILGLCVASINNGISCGNEIESLENSEHILIASTSERADIKIWDCSNSNFIFFVNAYEKYITDLTFNKDATCILSSSIEGIVKIHGLKSERTIKYFPKNSEFSINKVSYNNSETMVISALSNGNIDIWDIKSSSCIATYDICCSQIFELKPINNINFLLSIQKSDSLKKNIEKFDFFFVGSRSGMYLVDIYNGEVVNLPIEENLMENLFSATFNSKLNIIICLLKNSKILLYDIKDRKMNYKEIEYEDSYQYEQIFTGKFNGNIAVSGKNKFFVLSEYYQISNHVDTDSNIELISSDSKL
ncbi:WD-40 repeat-containing protein [Cryptosporidium ubiquitum]|uniref:WD-40 repeat-containing protein n=1 Tax=Cryptosporidium ubiquitum TaxID=857276 RepID=A0A1J4MLE3_9CRYT|nr:WD-40 repeat-containing protein [Cryptosporidium ubiquitum]OII74275.1 WD-40 repeat-containing protein [Cryptosporidium ubiquitum]